MRGGHRPPCARSQRCFRERLMSSVGLLIAFAILGAFICAKTRSAAGAVVFALIALVLFVGTPVGQGLPGAIASVKSTVDRAATPALDGTQSADVAGGAR